MCPPMNDSDERGEMRMNATASRNCSALRDVPALVRLACCAVVLVGLALLPRAAAAEDFYAGKTITISTHGGVGGEYDGYLRLLQRFFGKYIPGNPNVVVINQVGAGG